MLRFTFYFLFSIFFLGLVSLAAAALFILPDLPDIDSLRDVKMQIPLRVYTQEGALISEYGEKRRIPVTIEEVPPLTINAFLAAEDDRFYTHPGVDWHGIARAVINLIKTGQRTQGGSTITMQVARNFFLSREKTYLRKLNEIFLSFKIERELSKDEILELYLNKIYLGQRAYGIGAAAQVYYGETLNNLSLPQTAMIAGLPKAPSTTNPVTNPEGAFQRRNYVLGRMLDLEFITREEYETAIAAPDSASLHSPAIGVEAPYVAEMVRKQMVDTYGDLAYSDGYRIYTTIKNKNQSAANSALRKGLLEYDQRHGYRGPEHHFELENNNDDPANEEPQAIWQQLLSGFPEIGGLQAALVTEVNEDSATAFSTDSGVITLKPAGYEWARKYYTENSRGPVPKKATDVFKAGDIIRITKDKDGNWLLAQIPNVEGGLVSLDPNNGSILALVGGFDFQRSKFNRITQAMRQPGSSFKPFIYSAALETGYTAASLINDAPIVFDDPALEGAWRPENYSGKNYGPTRLREALTHSRNLVSIRLLHDIGIPQAMPHIARFGFNTEQLPHNLSLALGSGAVTPWQIASAYSVLANGGYQIEPYFVDRIETSGNEILFQANPLLVCHECPEEPAVDAEVQPTIELDSEENIENIVQSDETQPASVESVIGIPLELPVRYAQRVVNAPNIYLMNSMTRDVIKYGTARRALTLHRPDLSGKTGTTNDQRDAWFSGYNPSIVAISWMGFDEYSKTLGRGETGARAALPIWIDYMADALEDIPISNPVPPPGMTNIWIDRTSGQPTTADNPDGFFEIFRTEHAPVLNQEQITKPGDNSEEIPVQLF